MDTMDKVLAKEAYIKLIEGCGRGCYNRHQFKKDISKWIFSNRSVVADKPAIFWYMFKNEE